MSSPIGRPDTCGRSGTSSSAASPARSSSRFQSSGATSCCTNPYVTGRCVSFASRRIQSSSLSGADMSSPWMPAGASSKTPRPTSANARPSANSSSSAANVPGTGSPSTARCTIVRDVVTPDRAGVDRFGDDAGHLRDVVGRRGLVARAALAHDVGAHRAVRHLRADVERELRGVERVEELGEALPRPADAFRQRGAGDVLDALHQPDEPLAPFGGDRGEPDAAVAHQRAWSRRASSRG